MCTKGYKLKVLFVSGGNYERLVKEAFRDPDTTITIAENCNDCISLLQSFKPDLVIINDQLLDADAEDIAKVIRDLNKEIKILLIDSGHFKKNSKITVFSKVVRLPIEPTVLKIAVFSLF